MPIPNKSLRQAVEPCHGMTVPGEAGSLRNVYATALMTDMKNSSANWGTSPKFFEGAVIIARSDRTDLDLGSAIRVCRYCVEVPQPLLRRVQTGEITRYDVMREVSL